MYVCRGRLIGGHESGTGGREIRGLIAVLPTPADTLNEAPVVAPNAHKEGCTYVVRHWNITLAEPARIPNTRAVLIKQAKGNPEHGLVVELCAVHNFDVPGMQAKGFGS